jgi:hypothetical protein
VMEIGRKSDGMNGTEILATGRIDVDFHWLGATEVDNYKIIILPNESAKTVHLLVKTMQKSSSDRIQCVSECQVF